MSNTNKERICEVLLYLQFNGEQPTLDFFKINTETLTRYKRKAKQEYNLNIDGLGVLNEIAKNFTPQELQAIAKGGRINPAADNIPIVNFDGERLRFGVMGDTHFGSKYLSIDMVDKAFNEFKKEGCELVVHTGDITEGMSHRPGHVYELSELGYDAQLEKAVSVLSQWDKPFYAVSGNHDRWYLKNSDAGANIVKAICEKLPQGTFLAHDTGDIVLNDGKASIRLHHGEDGSSYALSYRVQKVVESYTGGEKPSVLILGHVHKYVQVFIRHIHCLSAGSLQRQTSWMKSKRLDANTGFGIVDIWLSNEGVSKFRNTWYPFYC